MTDDVTRNQRPMITCPRAGNDLANRAEPAHAVGLRLARVAQLLVALVDHPLLVGLEILQVLDQPRAVERVDLVVDVAQRVAQRLVKRVHPRLHRVLSGRDVEREFLPVRCGPLAQRVADLLPRRLGRLGSVLVAGRVAVHAKLRPGERLAAARTAEALEQFDHAGQARGDPHVRAVDLIAGREHVDRRQRLPEDRVHPRVVVEVEATRAAAGRAAVRARLSSLRSGR
jgi:hypothetical protein